MSEQTSKQEILDRIREERGALEATLDRLEPEQMTQPGVESDWSVKDILAHITAWERLMVQWIEESLRGEVPERPAPGMTWDDLDRFNEQLYDANKHLSLEEVVEAFRSSYQRALETVAGLTEEDLLDPARFEWRGGDPLWHMVGGNTFWHYREHNETITDWMEGTK